MNFDTAIYNHNVCRNVASSAVCLCNIMSERFPPLPTIIDGTSGERAKPLLRTTTFEDAEDEIVIDTLRFGTIEEEEEDERLWVEQFANSEDFLMQLASEARESRRLGLLMPLETIFDD